MTQEFTVRDMSCGHCVAAITNEVQAVPGVHQVSIDLASKRVRVDAGDDVATETLVNAINEAGYVDISVPR
jgi:copper chaperone